jgi:nitrite reductase (NO-forming)
LKKFLIACASALALSTLAANAHAAKVDLNLTAIEAETEIDNNGAKQASWTFGGQIPGPVLRVKEGDLVTMHFTNDAKNKNSHSVDLHAARIDVLKDFEPVKPGETRTFTFTATHPGAFYYHCGADPMYQHIARGMFGVIIVDPKDDKAMPKADREYVILQSELYKNPDDLHSIMKSDWSNVVFNGTAFKYDPVHDANATKTLVAKPGERVRIYYINAGPNETSSFHPIGGMWDAVWPSGNPANKLTGMQSYLVGPGDGAIFDLIGTKPGANVIVDHVMSHAHTGAMAVIMFSDDADPAMGRGQNLVVR